jgi:glycosyltransferase involved in cell wall biosynthesis
MNDDITWHISKSNLREELTYDFIKSDKRIKVYNCNCDDTNTTIKRNTALEKIKNSYFCFLDDDTIFHENIYIKYKECEEQNFIGMMVGEQLDYDNKIRLIASKPIFRHIDTGNVLSHYSCLSECRWPESHMPKVNQKDFLFWNSVYEFYGKKCAIWNQPISYYNKLNPKQIYGTKKEKHLK